MQPAKFFFITLPRMGTKHVQDQLVRAFRATDHIEGHETFVYKNRDFRLSLGEYFRNYGFAEHVIPNSYYMGGQRYFDDEKKYEAGLPAGCYAYQIAYEDGWKFVKRDYVNYFLLTERDFREKYGLLRQHGKSYVVKLLFNQHTPEQLNQLLQLTPNVVCYLKADILSWMCSYSLIGRYSHSDPQSIEPSVVGLGRANGLIELLRNVIRFCKSRDIPIVVNRGEDEMRVFGCVVKNFVTQEFSRFKYENIITDYKELSGFVQQAGDVFDS